MLIYYVFCVLQQALAVTHRIERVYFRIMHCCDSLASSTLCAMSGGGGGGGGGDDIH